MTAEVKSLPIIDISPLIEGAKADASAKRNVAEQIGSACRALGFFYVVGHGVSEPLQQQLEKLSHEFFARPLEEKLGIRMELGGPAWRGYFPVGAELTSGQPDLKEGLYFGSELPAEHPRVRARTPLHGPNLFPERPTALREVVLSYLEAMERLGHVLMSGIALSLGLEERFFEARYLRQPTVLFRIFNYPPDEGAKDGRERWGVGEHTDYGVLTLLKQDDAGGLQVKSQSKWIEAPPVPNSFVCNLGDMLERMTAGLYRSTPHRVRNLSGRQRLSFPYFFDPDFDAEIRPVVAASGEIIRDDSNERWDQSSVHAFQGTYGQYLLSKVAKVFPQLVDAVL
jgi:isopenicillin N synthase-like dioxygenase